MNNEVINLLLKDGIISSAVYDNSYKLFFLTTHFLDDTTGIPIELIYDESGKHVISVVGKAPCSPGGVNYRSALWRVNQVNSTIIESEGLGSWILNTQCGNFLYTASCPKFISPEATFEFCKATVLSFLQTRNHFANFV